MCNFSVDQKGAAKPLARAKDCGPDQVHRFFDIFYPLTQSFDCSVLNLHF